MPKLTLEMDMDTDPIHAGDQVNDAIKILTALRERFWDGETVTDQSDLILDSIEDDDLIGNYRIDR